MPPISPQGPSQGKVSTVYIYVSFAEDSDGDCIRYGWDWDGDGVIDEYTGYVQQGVEQEIAHLWDERGDHVIRVLAEDEHGGVSPWSDPLVVTISREKKQMIAWFFESLKELWGVWRRAWI